MKIKNILLIDNESVNITYLSSYLSDLNISYKLINYKDILNINIGLYDLIVLSGGSSFSVKNHLDKYKEEINLITNSNKPVIGICLGFQIIVAAFNNTNFFIKNPSKVEKIIDIKITNNHPIFNSHKYFSVKENHFWNVLQVNEPLVELARSSNGVELITHKSKKIFGIQFHPEMLINKTDGKIILNNIINYLEFI